MKVLKLFDMFMQFPLMNIWGKAKMMYFEKGSIEMNEQFVP